eukprot:3096826-Pyramimonas_sp.AAC.1
MGSKNCVLQSSTIVHQWDMVRIASSVRVGAGGATGSLSNNKSSSAEWSGGRVGEDEVLAPVGLAFAFGVGSASAAGVPTGADSQTSRWLRGAGNLTNS